MSNKNLRAVETTNNVRHKIVVDNMRIVDVVENSNVSVRLANCMSRTKTLNNQMLPVETIGEYFSRYPDIRKEFLRKLYAFGKSTDQELSDLLKSWVSVASNALNIQDFARITGFQTDNVESKLQRLGVQWWDIAGNIDKPKIKTLESIQYDYLNHFRLHMDTVDFPEVLLKHKISVRLRNSLLLFRRQNGEGCRTLGEFLSRYQIWLRRFSRQANVGKKTVRELNDLIRNLMIQFLTLHEINEEDANDIVDFVLNQNRTGYCSKSLLNALKRITKSSENKLHFDADKNEFTCSHLMTESAVEIEKRILYILRNLSNERAFDIINRRYGLEGNRIETLQTIADSHGVTRERVRQIEKQIIEQCRVLIYKEAFSVYLNTQYDSIMSAIFDESYFVLRTSKVNRRFNIAGMEKFSIQVVHKDVENWLDTYAEPISDDNGPVGWLAPNVQHADRKRLIRWVSEGGTKAGAIKKRIEACIRHSPWPLTISYLSRCIPDISAVTLDELIRRIFNAHVDGCVISHIENLRVSTRLILVLREAGRALHLSSVRAAHMRLFRTDIKESTAGATLGRLNEVLIVGRGTYNLYQNLNLNTSDINAIRDIASAELSQLGHFLSAKLLVRNIKNRLPKNIAHKISAYSLHGVCQDDTRFITKRGLMIGLAKPGFEKTFTSLTDSIHDIVRDSGPVSVDEIKRKLSHERSVLSVNILMVLRNSTEIIAAGFGEYDFIDRVIGNDRAITRLSKAIEIALIDQNVSLPVLRTRLAAVGYKLDNMTILSFLSNQQEINKTHDLFSLRFPSSEVEEYNDFFYKVYNPQTDSAHNIESLRQAVSDHYLRYLIELDFRLLMDPNTWSNADSNYNEDAKLLTSMIAEFEF